MTGAAVRVSDVDAGPLPRVVPVPDGGVAQRSTRAKRRSRRSPSISQDRLPVALIVEDEPASADLWRSVLARRGWIVEHAPTAADALRCLTHAGARIDLAILDDRLPDGRGLHLATLLRALRPETVLALVSAYGDAERWTDARKAGFSLVHKPASEAECTALLDLLGAHRDLTSAAPVDTRAGAPLLVLTDDGVATPDGAVRLRPKEHAALSFLLAHEGEAMTTVAIGARIGRTDKGAARAVHKQISNLRRALGLYRSIVQTVPGLGYRLRPGLLRRERM